MQPLISVVVPVGPTNAIRLLLESLRGQTAAPESFEVILIHDSDVTVVSDDVVEGLGLEVRQALLPDHRRSSGHTGGACRNVGAAMARSPFLLFLDSDVIAHPACVENHLASQSPTGCGLAGSARQLPVSSAELLVNWDSSRYADLLDATQPDHRLEPHDEQPLAASQELQLWDMWYTNNASVPKAPFLAVRGFTEDGSRCHDQQLAYRLFKSGLPFAFLPAAEVIHIEHPRSMAWREQQILGWRNMQAEYPELATYAEDLINAATRQLERTREDAKQLFASIVRELPGFPLDDRHWLVAANTPEQVVASAVADAPYLVSQTPTADPSALHMCVRLDRHCWDYVLVVPHRIDIEAPRVTVIIPTYHGHATIERAVRSVFSQSMQDFELLVIDDGSEATEHALLRKRLAAFAVDPRFRLIDRPRNEGLSATLNVGLQLARGKYVCQLDDDDWYEPVALEAIVDAFSEHLDAGGLFGDAIVHSGGAVPGVARGPSPVSPLGHFEYPHYQVPRAFRRQVLLRAGGWSVSDAYAGRVYDDRLVLSRVAQLAPVYQLATPVYHVMERQGSLSRGDRLNFASAKLAILWDQANRAEHDLSWAFEGELLWARLTPRVVKTPGFGWSVIIPFQRSLVDLELSLQSWMESDFNPETCEIIVVDGSVDGCAAQSKFASSTSVRIVRAPAQAPASLARNMGAALARGEFLFFSDEDQIVPPHVLGLHERRHCGHDGRAVVVGNVFGRRAAVRLTPDYKGDHVRKALSTLAFSSQFSDVCGALAYGCGALLPLPEGLPLWRACHAHASTDEWMREWGRLIIQHGLNLDGYPDSWTRLSSGSMSLRSSSFELLKGFDTEFPAMEDWELGMRCPGASVRVLCAPDAEPYHLVHARDDSRPARDREAARLLFKKHPRECQQLFNGASRAHSAAARVLVSALASDEAAPPCARVCAGPAAPFFGLTFDDGPHPLGTSNVLDALRDHGGKATFFLLGSEVSRYPDLCRRIADEGHELAVHAWVHCRPSSLTSVEWRRDLLRTMTVIESVTGVRPTRARPPYGNLTHGYAAAAHAVGLDLVGWHVSANDWSAQLTRDIQERLAVAGVRGRVVLMHDGAGDPAIVASAVRWLLESARLHGALALAIRDWPAGATLPPAVPGTKMGG